MSSFWRDLLLYGGFLMALFAFLGYHLNVIHS